MSTNTIDNNHNLNKIEQSNITDSLLSNELKLAIKEYTEIICETPIFNDNINKQDIKDLLNEFLQDLYVQEPQELLNYIGQKPSDKLTDTIFERYGIASEFIKDYPSLLKTKTAYLLNSLIESKGTIKTFEHLSNILSEFYKDINFYKVIVDIREQGNRYDDSTILYKYMMINDELIEKYKDPEYGSGVLPPPQSIVDKDIELKFFVTYNPKINKVEYDIRLFDIQKFDVYLKFNTMDIDEDPIMIPRGQTELKYLKTAFDTSAIQEYKKVFPIALYYNNLSYYDITDPANLIGKIDNNIQYNIKTFIQNSTVDNEAEVRYIIDFGKAHPYDIKIALNKTSVLTNGVWDYNFLTLKVGDTKIDTNDADIGNIKLTAQELEYEEKDKQKARTENDLIYRLEPVLINDPNNVQTEINNSLLFSRKFLMNKIDFFDTDVDNLYKRNVFPITTNMIHIQLGTSVIIDNTKMHPDLIRMYGLTYLNNGQVMKFKIGNNTFKLNIQDYIDVLAFMKFKQLEITTDVRYENTHFDSAYFYQYKLSAEKLKDIYDLHLYYQNMPFNFEYFKIFKDRFNNLLFTTNQKYVPTVKSMDDFKNYLAGNVPKTLDELYNKINTDFPVGVNFKDGFDQNYNLLLIVNKIKDPENNYNIQTVEEFLEIISNIDINESRTAVTIYDSIRNKFSIKQPRLVALLDNLTTVDSIIETYLYNYKVALDYVSKMDNLVEYFINDLYQLYIQSTVFKQRFFNPVIKLFEQYFFKAEQVYKTESSLFEVVKDKTNVIPTSDHNGIEINKDNVYSIAFHDDKSSIQLLVENFIKNGTSFLDGSEQINRLKFNDNFKIEVFDTLNKDANGEPILKSVYSVEKNETPDTVWVDKI